MNACSVHLLEFFKAKSKLAEQRKHRQVTKLGEREETEFQDRFASFLSGEMYGERYQRALRNLGEVPSVEDSDYLRRFFHERGCEVMGVSVPLVEESDVKMKKKEQGDDPESGEKDEANP